MPRTLYLIDGHAQIYRAYYAPFRDLTSPSGEPTRATYVFFQMLLSLVRSRRPDYLAVVLDADESKLLRKQLYPQYKANRDPAPEDLETQERRIIALLDAAGVPMLRLTGYEADDIMARWCVASTTRTCTSTWSAATRISTSSSRPASRSTTR